MNNALKITSAAIAVLVIGFLAGLKINVQTTPVYFFENEIELQLTRYKQAQEICGKHNVEEVTEYVNARTEKTGDYTCESFAEAAKTPEERLAEEEEDRLYSEWIVYQRGGGIMNFNEWRGVVGE